LTSCASNSFSSNNLLLLLLCWRLQFNHLRRVNVLQVKQLLGPLHCRVCSFPIRQVVTHLSSRNIKTSSTPAAAAAAAAAQHKVSPTDLSSSQCKVPQAAANAAGRPGLDPVAEAVRALGKYDNAA
jgi:hypothetical protein